MRYGLGSGGSVPEPVHHRLSNRQQLCIGLHHGRVSISTHCVGSNYGCTCRRVEWGVECAARDGSWEQAGGGGTTAAPPTAFHLDASTALDLVDCCYGCCCCHEHCMGDEDDALGAAEVREPPTHTHTGASFCCSSNQPSTVEQPSSRPVE